MSNVKAQITKLKLKCQNFIRSNTKTQRCKTDKSKLQISNDKRRWAQRAES